MDIFDMALSLVNQNKHNSLRSLSPQQNGPICAHDIFKLE